MESLEADAIRNYLREKRLKTLNNLMILNGKYNTYLNELKDKRGELAERRRTGEIGLKEFWNMRVDLEERIQDIEEKRDEVVKKIVAIFPKTKV